MFLRCNGNSESQPCLYVGVLSEFAISANECTQYNLIKYNSLEYQTSTCFGTGVTFSGILLEQGTANQKRQSIYWLIWMQSLKY
jgi:hypothetical protein